MNLSNSYNNVALKYSPDLFNTERYAHSYASRSRKFNRVIMGEAGQYLVVCNADAQRLVRAGYELA